MISRSLAAGNSIIPDTANSISGKTSVCSSPRVEASRSASVPGSADAWPAKASTPPSSWRSAKSSTAQDPANTSTIAQLTRVGPSIASAPSATTRRSGLALEDPDPAYDEHGEDEAATRVSPVSTACTR